jgi:hypothetical protein
MQAKRSRLLSGETQRRTASASTMAPVRPHCFKVKMRAFRLRTAALSGASSFHVPRSHGGAAGKENSSPLSSLLTQNLHLTPNTQQAEQASFTREEIPRRASQFFLKINKR